jgi:hypothetical protein
MLPDQPDRTPNADKEGKTGHRFKQFNVYK